MFRPRHFSKDYPDHESLHHHTEYALDAHDEYGFGTLFSGETRAITDGVLSLNAEQETRCEIIDIGHAWLPIRFFRIVWQMGGL